MSSQLQHKESSEEKCARLFWRLTTMFKSLSIARIDTSAVIVYIGPRSYRYDLVDRDMPLWKKGILTFTENGVISETAAEYTAFLNDKPPQKQFAARLREEFPTANVSVKGNDIQIHVGAMCYQLVWLGNELWRFDNWDMSENVLIDYLQVHLPLHQRDNVDRASAHETETEAQHPATNKTTETIATDATNALWRTAGSQFIKLAREPLVGLLTRHVAPGDETFRVRLAAFLETELGTALLASMLSASLSALPQTTGEVPQMLARELRVRAMADGSDVLADVLMGPLRQFITQ